MYNIVFFLTEVLGWNYRNFLTKKSCLNSCWSIPRSQNTLWSLLAKCIDHLLLLPASWFCKELSGFSTSSSFDGAWSSNKLICNPSSETCAFCVCDNNHTYHRQNPAVLPATSFESIEHVSQMFTFRRVLLFSVSYCDEIFHDEITLRLLRTWPLWHIN